MAISAVLALLSLWSAPLLAAMAAGSGRNLPACCRRNGKHHCMMPEQSSRSQRLPSPRPHEKCPCFPKSLLPGTARVGLFTLPPGGLFFAAIPKPSGSFCSDGSTLPRSERPLAPEARSSRKALALFLRHSRRSKTDKSVCTFARNDSFRWHCSAHAKPQRILSWIPGTHTHSFRYDKANL